MSNQATRNSVVEVLQPLGHVETLLRRRNNHRKLRYSFLFHSLGVLKNKGKEIVPVLGLILHLSLSRKQTWYFSL